MKGSMAARDRPLTPPRHGSVINAYDSTSSSAFLYLKQAL
jgi:hypothetical protein